MVIFVSVYHLITYKIVWFRAKTNLSLFRFDQFSKQKYGISCFFIVTYETAQK